MRVVIKQDENNKFIKMDTTTFYNVNDTIQLGDILVDDNNELIDRVLSYNFHHYKNNEIVTFKI